MPTRTRPWTLGLLALTLALGSLSPATAATSYSTPIATLKPSAAPATTVLKNTGSGQYDWMGHDKNSSMTNQDHYERLYWSDIETSKNVYDSWAIDRGLDAAQKSGGKYGFRVMAVCQDCGLPKSGTFLPKDMDATAWRTSQGMKIPDWNSEAFLSRWESLMTTLGKKYDGDPRLGYVDVGGYGNWGEWHSYPFEDQYTGTGSKRDITEANAQRMVRAVTKAFPRTNVLLSTTSGRVADVNGAKQKQWTYDWSNRLWADVLAASPRVGIRNDCLGAGLTQQSAVNGYNAADAYTNGALAARWRKAPVVTEYCGPSSFVAATPQIKAAHVSALSSDNFSGSLASYSAQEQAAYRTNVLTSGYRYRVTSTTFTRTASGAVQVSSTWHNDGVAPTYDAWKPQYVMVNRRTGARMVVTSTAKMSDMLPGDTTVNDTYDLGAPTGDTYDVYVNVASTASHIKPMSLAMPSRYENGSYPLGAVTY